MSINDKNKFYLLNYDHEKIEQLLKKIDEGWVLTAKEHDVLINEKGVENLSVFSGWYNDLLGLPDLEGIIGDAIDVNNEEFAIMIQDFVIDRDNDIIDIIDELKLEIFNNRPTTEEFYNKLAEKADLNHNHDEAYALKEFEHAHENKLALDSISEEGINNWNNNITVTNEVKELLDLSVEEIDALQESVNEIIESNVKTEVFEEMLDKYADLNYVDAEIEALEESVYNKEAMDKLLAGKVDKEEGKGLSSNDLTNELHALLLEILNDANNEAKTVNEFVLDRIDNALLDPDSELAKALAGKVNAEEGKGLSDNNFTDEQMALLEEILNGSDVDGDGAISVLDFINKAIDDDIANIDDQGTIGNLLAGKVDKVDDKDLSSNDFTDEHKAILDEILGQSTDTDMTDFIKNVIQDSINDKNTSDLIVSIGEALLSKADKQTFVTLDIDENGSIEVVADDIQDAIFNEATMIKLADAQLINPEFEVGDKLAEVEKDMGLSEVPFTEEQSNFLNQVMAQGATNEDAVKEIIANSISAVEEDGVTPAVGSINEALAQRDALIAEKVDNDDFELFQEEVNDALETKVNNDDFELYKLEVDEDLALKLNISDFETYQQEVINTYATKEEVNTALDGKVDKVDGMGLSANDYTNEDKAKLDSIALVTEAEIDAAFVAAGFDI